MLLVEGYISFNMVRREKQVGGGCRAASGSTVSYIIFFDNLPFSNYVLRKLSGPRRPIFDAINKFSKEKR
jgi:hypothetical protein